MSGGVDSSVAAYLMKERKFDIIGVTMRLFTNEDIASCEKSCCTLDDVEDAKQVARRLGIDHYVFNFNDDFKSEVIDRFINAYETGRTPNPCIDCNRFIKFKRLLQRAKELDYDYVVTGHYARVETENGRPLLKKGKDHTKDQSYVLYSLTKEQLKHIILPLGSMEKSEVRDIALENGFINANKRDSQDICFVPDGKYADFIRQRTGREYPAGDFVDAEGKVLGRHKGLIQYTIGQRRGLGLALPAPLYVRRKNMADNTVLLTPESELYTTRLVADSFNWVDGVAPAEPVKVTACTR